MKIKFLGLLSLLIGLSFSVYEKSNQSNQIGKSFSTITQKVDEIYPPAIESSILVEKETQTNFYSKKGVGIGTGCGLKIIIKGCGNGFKVSLYDEITGEPYVDSISYQVYTMGWAITDFGFVAHNENTSWVLEPCTEYRVIFFPPKCTTEPIMITAITDGCGGIFIC
jgi:hypothetical protein